MTNRARMYLRYRDLDIPTSWEGATRERGRPARNLRASSLRSRGHSLEQCTKTDFVISSLGNPKLIPMATR